MYNGEEQVWQGSFSARLASVWSCSSKPMTSGCGGVFWSRPGLLKAMCKFDGLSMFPNDMIRCDLEFAAWTIDGRFQDIAVPEANGGITWIGDPNSQAVAGITAGASKFQDYMIQNITSTRLSVFYDCCPQAPFPEIIFRVEIKRANTYYFFKLILPGIGLTLLSFVTYWMNPAIGERLGYAITVILAMVAQEITAAELMPVCNFRTLFDYFSAASMLFGATSVVETGIVLFLYHQEADNWMEALLPEWLENNINLRFLQGGKAAGEGSKVSKAVSKKRIRERMSQMNQYEIKTHHQRPHQAKAKKNERIRKQIYRQLFFVLDQDFSGKLNLEEITDFLETVGAEHSTASRGEDDMDLYANLKAFMDEYDVNQDASLEFEEFCKFCDLEFAEQDDINYISKVVKGFLEVVERRQKARAAMWQSRALAVDQFARWTVPVGFAVFLVWLYSLDENSLTRLMLDGSLQTVFTLSGILPLCLGLVCFIVFCFGQAVLNQRRTRRAVAVARANAVNEVEVKEGLAFSPQREKEYDDSPQPNDADNDERTPKDGFDGESSPNQNEVLRRSDGDLQRIIFEAQLPLECHAKAKMWCDDRGLLDMRELGDLAEAEDFMDSISLKQYEKRRFLNTMKSHGWSPAGSAATLPKLTEGASNPDLEEHPIRNERELPGDVRNPDARRRREVHQYSI
eukprot:gnl/MRDRNA2_/MRDRNA2_61232_c0_seq1.p1 gnl/MRDRNA2_/MRDRNA2_61232_c0~~gnl/MRDRNA2_/MRDRNA2_61232_c0_seq1.p1  ORF type:complete len:684 (+),score=135.99 gnl/MRDRNA2_/MRDRNA2_61232_c0_seq1:44-2095(+)